LFSFLLFFGNNNRGFARFVNLKDDNGATPLHLASRQGRASAAHILLDNSAIVSSLTGLYGYGSIVGFLYLLIYIEIFSFKTLFGILGFLGARLYI
jgi:ankyrin repeat protein